MSDTPLLSNKTALVCGIANDHSIAWGVAKQLHAHGARVALSYATEKLERRVRPLAEQIHAVFYQLCDVTDDGSLDALFERSSTELGHIDILVHAIAFADRDELSRGYSNTSRKGFGLAMEISVYSLVALAQRALPLMGEGSSIMAMTYYGSEKVAHNYNVMGVAKAALESSVRYLAADLGPQGIRVNAISPGPIRTLSAAGVPGFKEMHRENADQVPLRRNVDIEDVGNTAVWLGSELSRNTTGQVIYVDAGGSILA
jgi:enoyl-[acyl-carrier protein] reductase I